MTWMAEGDNKKKASLSDATTWVKEAWEDILAEMVKKSSLKTGVSNCMDGTGDDSSVGRIRGGLMFGGLTSLHFNLYLRN